MKYLIFFLVICTNFAFASKKDMHITCEGFNRSDRRPYVVWEMYTDYRWAIGMHDRLLQDCQNDVCKQYENDKGTLTMINENTGYMIRDPFDCAKPSP